MTQSNGEVRPNTEGARTRHMFKKLPGVGNRMALHWWQKGLRCKSANAGLMPIRNNKSAIRTVYYT